MKEFKNEVRVEPTTDVSDYFDKVVDIEVTEEIINDIGMYLPHSHLLSIRRAVLNG